MKEYLWVVFVGIILGVSLALYMNRPPEVKFRTHFEKEKLMDRWERERTDAHR